MSKTSGVHGAPNAIANTLRLHIVCITVQCTVILQSGAFVILLYAVKAIRYVMCCSPVDGT